MSWSPNPIFSQRSAAQGFSVRNESGPASTRQPSTRSVTSTPPRRGLDSNKTYSTSVPDWRFSSIVNAAERPEIPPPMMAMRFMVSALGSWLPIWTRLEQNVLDVCARLALLFDRKRGREAGDSAADDGYAFHGVSSWLLASSSWRLLSPLFSIKSVSRGTCLRL